ncbi:hypothetical protein CAC42_7355 [Sphaceloma murrayae]|uniref:Uncharacterized protein n=1 Tax=Sphaceloma murrayae TaxID=2082308 RepID=A0A2K1QWT4_9PEZI|nr:hypothetical protein CAC42_7355 [Sphaceloma murrayae]
MPCQNLAFTFDGKNLAQKLSSIQSSRYMQLDQPILSIQHLASPHPRGPRMPLSPLLHQRLLREQTLTSNSPPTYKASLESTVEKFQESSLYKDTMKRNHVVILILVTFVLGLLVVWAIYLKATHEEIRHETKAKVRQGDLESQLEEEESRR